MTRVRPEVLFLSFLRQLNAPITTTVIEWFRQLLVTDAEDDDKLIGRTIELLREEEGRQKVEAIISLFDTGADESDVEETVLLRLKGRNEKHQEVVTRHPFHNRDGTPDGSTTFKLNFQESQGTRKLVAMAGLIVDVLERGQIWFIDELDARLHPLVSRKIVELFHDSDFNLKGAQLIFATHDANLLDRTLLRRDQIWFAEKDTQGAAHLYSLLEFWPRNDISLERNYLAGRYGAVPYLGDFSRLPQVARTERTKVA